MGYNETNNPKGETKMFEQIKSKLESESFRNTAKEIAGTVVFAVATTLVIAIVKAGVQMVADKINETPNTVSE